MEKRRVETQQSINFALEERRQGRGLGGRGLAFAFPVRTVHVACVLRASVEGREAGST
jgi:hypothetical protein